MGTTTHGTAGAPPPDALELAVQQADLARALRLVGRAVPARAALPALHHVLLDATPGRLTLTATDLALGLMAALPAAVARPLARGVTVSAAVYPAGGPPELPRRWRRSRSPRAGTGQVGG